MTLATLAVIEGYSNETAQLTGPFSICVDCREQVKVVQTLKRRKILATMMDSVEKDAPMTPVTGLCGTYNGGCPDSH